MGVAVPLLVACIWAITSSQAWADSGVDQYLEQAPGAGGQTSQPSSSSSGAQGSNATGAQGSPSAGTAEGTQLAATPGRASLKDVGKKNDEDSRTNKDDLSGRGVVAGSGPTTITTSAAEVSPTGASNSSGGSTALLVAILLLLTAAALLTGYLVRRRGGLLGPGLGGPGHPRHDS
jgi:cobalamin biosynthesis Mg chelatase CobN